ncbi:conserved unknown protein [Ectocarpus siliculosus]|uniref:Phosphodiesterase n=1 Tax=Ectocarpus siliculosus TaxID=2880 RepID=D7G2I4_ECTSI|nr:conserved unknown protein [Ectocarpus siliculosus]|eukprot:CBJ33418.1 conserved unknown protein [Ectocarpus siliculosus]
MPAPRLSSRSRRSLRGRSRGARRNTSDSSSCNGIYVTGTEVLHTDPLTRQLMLMLLAVETKAKVSMPEERGGGSVNREWIRLKLKELLTMVGRSDVDLEQLDTHTFYCKDRKENQYGPFPAKQLVEAHNAGYINDRKVLVKEARMKGEFRPMGARALMHGPSSDEAFKSLTMWPQVDAHHPLADRILSPSDGSSHDFREWGFNIFGLDKQELGMLAATVLAETGLPRTFGISMKTFAHFMSAVGFFMGRNPRVSYHNLYHAVDVMHATYLTLDGMGASGLLTVTEQLALILSALCHDLDHPGLTNSFQMATESPLASLYNDQAPLEHHHLAIMFQILRREGCDILGHLEKPQRTRIREVMIQGILATEMSEHGTHISKVDKLTNDFPSITLRVGGWASGDIGRGTDRSNPGPLLSPPQPGGGGGGGKEALGMSFSSMGPPSMRGGPRMGPRALLQVPGAEAAALGLADSDRLAVASALLHAADLSSPGRPFATCKVWVLRLLEEFKFQAEQERQRGLRVTVLEGPPSASQPGFIDAFLLPFFTALLPIAPGLADEYIPNLQDNRNQWAAIAEQEAQLASPDRSSNVDKAGDRSSTGSVTSTGPGSAGGGGSGGGVGRRNSGGADSNGNGGGGSGLPPPPPPQLSGSSSSPTTFDGQRRYSGGAIGIASMLGSLGTVPTGRSISDGSIDRRVSSIISTSPGVPPEFPGLRDGSAGASAGGGGGGAAWRRQSAMGPATGAGPEFGYPMWRGGAVRGASVPLGGAGWGERTAGDGEIVSEATAAAKAQGIPPAPAAAGSATGWTIDVGGGGVAGEVKAEEADSEEQQQGGGEERPEGGVEGQALPEALPE